MKKNKLKSMLPVLLSVVMVISLMSGCGSTATNDKTNAASSQTASTSDQSKAASTQTQKDLLPNKTLDNKTVTMYFWGKEFKKPDELAASSFVKKYGGELKVIPSGKEYVPGLVTLVMSGQSPDFVLGQDNAFPGYIPKGIVQQWDPYMDFSSPIFDQARTLLNMLTWQGKHYTAFNDPGASQIMYYNKQLFKDNNLTTPEELMDKGQWDWNAMLEAAKKITQDTNGDGKNDVFGVCTGGMFANALTWSTGTDFALVTSDGHMTNNVKDPKLASAMDFLYDLGSKYKVGTKSEDDFAKGIVGMQVRDPWRAGADYKDMLNKDTAGMVPFPKMPGADKHYVGFRHSNYMLCKGAKNPEGAALFLTSLWYDDYVHSKDPNFNPDQWMLDGGLSKTALAYFQKMNKLNNSLTPMPFQAVGVGINPSSAGDPTTIPWSVNMPKLSALTDKGIEPINNPK